MNVPPSESGPNRGISSRAAEWRKRLAVATLAYLMFETGSGLAVTFLPFSAASQWTVIVHTGIGLLFLVPVLAYQIRHLRVYWSRPLSANKAMGYAAALATTVALATGSVLTFQAIFGTRIGYGWSKAHLFATYALCGFLLPHVGIVLLRDLGLRALGGATDLLAAQRRALVLASVLALVMAAPIAALWRAYPGDRMIDRFPDDYSYKLGRDRPFAPSLAHTASGGAYDARSFSGSASCGTTRCHEQIAAEWSVSAHRWASMDPGFQRIQEEMAKQNGAESTRYCGGCHDPISLFSGTKNIFTEHLSGLAGYDEGVSCLVCHSVRKTDVLGNANYVVGQPRRYLFELHDGNGARALRDFLIRSYPKAHQADLSKRLFKTPEYCAACHKQFIDQEVNNVGWVQLQNQYDNWRKSRWNHPGDPRKTIECRECHMPLVASSDPAAGDGADYNRSELDGRHRSHRFVGANQLMPALLKIPGADKQVALTESWLKGQLEVPEIAGKWRTGPAVAIELDVPPEASAGEEMKVKAVVTSNKVGHDFPTGPLDIIQSWIEITVSDDGGREIFSSGSVDDRHFIAPGSFMFKAEPVDQYGNLIDRHNLWEMVGVRYRRSLFPGFSDTAEYAFRCPGGASNATVPESQSQSFGVAVPGGVATLHVKGRLMYRKIDQYLLNFMFGEGAGLTSPVTEMARAEKTVPIASGHLALAMDPPRPR
ncbi:MAG: multiheme c-type cytochrome [Acidobacteriota bacterium]